MKNLYKGNLNNYDGDLFSELKINTEKLSVDGRDYQLDWKMSKKNMPYAKVDHNTSDVLYMFLIFENNWGMIQYKVKDGGMGVEE